MTSCSTYYRMTSRIDTNGSMHREVYARGDSAFIAGNKTHNPLLFQLDTDWQIVNPVSYTHLTAIVESITIKTIANISSRIKILNTCLLYTSYC